MRRALEATSPTLSCERLSKHRDPGVRQIYGPVRDQKQSRRNLKSKTEVSENRMLRRKYIHLTVSKLEAERNAKQTAS